MQIIQETIDVGSLVLFHVGVTPYAGVVLRMLSPLVALVRVQTKDGLKEVELETGKLSIR